MRGGDLTENFSMGNLRPDSFIGAVCAFEGIKEGCALINGPIGCRSYTAYMIESQDPRASHRNRMQYYREFYFGQPRSPCTYIDEQDYIYGSKKVKPALQFLDKKNYGLIGIINSSGTSLIGDDVRRIANSASVRAKTVVVDSTGFTGSFTTGFKRAVTEILKAVLKRNVKKTQQSVNIIGPSVIQYNWKNDVEEIKRTLQLMGIDVISVICAGETLTNLEQAGQAELNILLYEEYGDTVTKLLEKEFGMPCLGFDELAPFGLSASEAWFGAIADHFGLPRNVVDGESQRVRMRCYQAIARVASFGGGTKGLSFGIFGDSSQVAPLVVFLHQYLGMYPSVIGLKEVGEGSYEFIKKYLADNSIDTSFLLNPDQYTIRENLGADTPDIILGSIMEEQISRGLDEKPAFMPISYPYGGRVMITHRPLIGFNGVLTLVEEIVNSLGPRMRR